MKCSYVKEDGSQCNAYAMTGADYCYLHSPEISDADKKLAQSRGGRIAHAHYVCRLEPLELTDGHSVINLLADTINRVRMATQEGDIDTKTASTIALLAGKLLEAHRVINLEAHVQKLELELGMRKSHTADQTPYNEAELEEEIQRFGIELAE